MPAPQPTNPPAAPATPPSFFVNQQMAPATKNISESPILSTPQSTNPNGSPKTKSSSPSKKKLMFGIGGVLLLLLVIGGGVGVYLTQTQQDTRQQASTPTGTARITIIPGSGTITGDSPQTIPLSLDLSSFPVSLSELTFVIAFTGQVPADIQFRPEVLNGFSPADVSLLDSDTGKTLNVSYKVPQGGTYTASTAKVNLGALTFTAPATGQLILRFQASDSKALVKTSGADILRPPSLITYTFQSSATPTPLVNELVDASDSASASDSARTLAAGLPNAGGVGGASESAALVSITMTPTRTPTKTPTGTITITTTLTPTPTSSRTSSLPAETQAKPVSGSAGVTYTLLGFGAALIAFGVRLIRQKPTPEITEE